MANSPSITGKNIRQGRKCLSGPNVPAYFGRMKKRKKGFVKPTVDCQFLSFRSLEENEFKTAQKSEN